MVVGRWRLNLGVSFVFGRGQVKMDPLGVGLIPPMLSVVFGVVFSFTSLLRARKNTANIFFTFLCISISMRPAQFLLQQVVSDTDCLMGIERGLFAVNIFLPFVVILFFHRTLNIREPLLERGVFCVSLFMAMAAPGAWFVEGLNTYAWGVIGKAGPLFPLVMIYGALSFGYIVRCAGGALNVRADSEERHKYRYLFVSVIGGSALMLLTGTAFAGNPMYPASNFMFVPMVIMAYGVFRHRILDVGTLVQEVGYKLIYGVLLLVPNFFVFQCIRPLIMDASFFILAPCLIAWYMGNHLYVTRVHPSVSRHFNRYEHHLKTAEGKFARDLLILRDTRSLVDEFGELVRSTLLFDSIRFFFAPSDEPGHLTDMDGVGIVLTEETTAWLVGVDRFIDRYLLNSDFVASDEGVRSDLMALFDACDGSCGVPLVQHGQLIGLVMFAKKQGGASVTPMEIGFLEKVSRYLSIALYNSRVYQAVTSLKDELELRRRELSREILERRRAGENLRKSESLYRLLAANILDTLVVVGVDNEIVRYASPSCLKLTGYTSSEVVGQCFRGFLTENSSRELAQVVPPPQEGAGFMAELEHKKKDGGTAWIEISGHFISTAQGGMEVVGLARDISERREAEMEKEALYQKLRQAQKMESIGVLAGGIAHDFNNILMAILGYTQLGAMYLGEKDGKAAEVVGQIEKAGIRAKELVSQILAFSRQDEQVRHAVDFVGITKEALGLMRPTLFAGVDIQSHFPEGPAMVVADPVQIHQIVVNLCTNASHAVEEGGGNIQISVRHTTLDEGEARCYGLEPGAFVALQVSDTGQGMDDEVRSRIFEPYFTTKRADKGTGMGLAVVHGILLSHNGAVVVDSSRERGSTFNVYLPEAKGGLEVPMEGHCGSKRCGGRVLFVDDETMLVDLAGEALTRMGFDVVAMDDPEDALARFAENPFAFDVVVTDMTMPHMSGLKLTERVHALNAKIPVILCTGFSNDLVGRRHEEMGVSMVLFKPVPMKELATAIGTVRGADDGAGHGEEQGMG